MATTVCTSTMCKTGRAAVAKMWYTLNYLRANEPSFNAAGFEPACRGIQASLDAVDSWYADLIPFNPTCCTIDDIGRQADALANQMLASVGAANIPPPPPQTDWLTVALVGGAILLLAVYSPQIKKALQ